MLPGKMETDTPVMYAICKFHLIKFSALRESRTCHIQKHPVDKSNEFHFFFDETKIIKI